MCSSPLLGVDLYDGPHPGQGVGTRALLQGTLVGCRGAYQRLAGHGVASRDPSMQNKLCAARGLSVRVEWDF